MIPIIEKCEDAVGGKGDKLRSKRREIAKLRESSYAVELVSLNTPIVSMLLGGPVRLLQAG